MGSIWQRARSWLAEVGGDIRESTDAGLLAVLRFFGFLYGPIDTSLPIDQAFRKAMGHRLPAHVGWRHALGGIAYLLFLILVVTGLALTFYYRPSAQEAFASIQHLVSGVTFGWLIRDLHAWSANLIVVAVLAHMAQVFFAGTYKPPRETNWVVGVLLLLLVVAFGATGYLLPWDQTSYWTTAEGLNALADMPIIGGFLAEILQGDTIVSGATLSRFFSVHVVLLPWLALGLLGFHFTMVRRHGVAPPPDAPANPPPGRRFFPNHLLRSFMVGILVLSAAITIAVLFPRPIGEPAQPGVVPEVLRPSWVVVDVSRGLVHYLGRWGFVLFTLMGFALMLLPLFDRGPERQLRRRPVALVMGLVYFLGFLGFWVVGRGLRTVPPQESLPPTEVVLPAPSPSPADSLASGVRP